MEGRNIDTRTRAEQIDGEIRALKQLLTNSDYKALKYAEGMLSEDEYASIRRQREDLRVQINDLEAELETINE